MYLGQSWDVLQPSLLQARLPDSHALVGAPHVGGQQLAQIPFSRNLHSGLQSIQVSAWIPLQRGEADWSGFRTPLSTCRVWKARPTYIQDGA